MGSIDDADAATLKRSELVRRWEGHLCDKAGVYGAAVDAPCGFAAPGVEWNALAGATFARPGPDERHVEAFPATAPDPGPKKSVERMLGNSARRLAWCSSLVASHTLLSCLGSRFRKDEDDLSPT